MQGLLRVGVQCRRRCSADSNGSGHVADVDNSAADGGGEGARAVLKTEWASGRGGRDGLRSLYYVYEKLLLVFAAR
jgi:hypothetical protein